MRVEELEVRFEKRCSEIVFQCSPVHYASYDCFTLTLLSMNGRQYAERIA